MTTANETTTAVALNEQPAQGGAISVYASEANFKSAQRMAMALCTSTLVPNAYRGNTNIPNVLIAMELANRIGASVLMVMQNLDVIHGKPSWRSTFLIATVNSSGRFSPLRFRWEGEPGSDDWGCRAVAKDMKTGDECLGSLITIGLAKSEGWVDRNGSKWKTMPEQMLMYRAAAFWQRAYAPELGLGMHTAEEIIDMGAVPQESAGVTEVNDAIEAFREAEEAVADTEDDAETEDPPAEPTGDPDMEEAAQLSEAQKHQMVKKLARVKKAEDLEPWTKLVADFEDGRGNTVLDEMLPEHAQVVVDKVAELAKKFEE